MRKKHFRLWGLGFDANYISNKLGLNSTNMYPLKVLNVAIKLLILIGVFGCFDRSSAGTSGEWQVLFNGKDLDGWTPKFYHHDLGDNYANTFRVVDGAIQVSYEDYTQFNERYGHLFYQESFSSFHLKFEYRFTDQWLEEAPDFTFRNSGVMFHSQDPKTILKEQNWPISVEYQMLADADDGKPRPTGNMCSPGTEVYYQGEMDPRHCISSSSNTYPWDQWVSADLIVYGDSLVIHQVDGETVLTYTKPQIGGEVVEGFDPAIKIDGKSLTQGYIGLQAEGQGVEFRDIRIRRLD